MSRRNTLLNASTEPSKTHRRAQSADARLTPSFHTPTTAALKRPVSSNPLQPQPITISSNEDEYEDEDDDGEEYPRTPTRMRPHIIISQSDTSLPPPGIPQSKKPARARRVSDIPVATDPGYDRKAGLPALNDNEATVHLQNTSPRGYSPRCGYSPRGSTEYVHLGNMRNHENKCSKCRKILLDWMVKDSTYTTKGTKLKKDPVVRVLQLKRTQEESEEAVHDNDNDKEGENEEDKEEKGENEEDKEDEGEEEEGEEEEGGEEEGGEEEVEEEEGGEEEVRKEKRGEEKRSGTSAQLTHAALIHVVCEKLTPEEKEGTFYLFRGLGLGKKGLVKVGYTTDILSRKKQLETQCGLHLELIWSTTVKHCKRIEKLTKLHLGHLCRPWQCDKCSREHSEWFEIEEGETIKIAKIWISWLHKQKPYGRNKKLKSIWSYTIKYSRLPLEDFVDHDHKSRLDHWNNVVLLPLSDDDTRRFHTKQILSDVLDIMDLPHDPWALLYFFRTAIPVVLVLWVLRR